MNSLYFQGTIHREADSADLRADELQVRLIAELAEAEFPAETSHANSQRLADCWNACHGLDLPADLPPGTLADAVTALRDLHEVMGEVMKQVGQLVFQDYGKLNRGLGLAQSTLARLQQP